MAFPRKHKGDFCMKTLRLVIELLLLTVLLVSCQLGDFENATTTQGSDPEATTPSITTEATTPSDSIETTTPNKSPDVTTPEGNVDVTTPEGSVDVTTPEVSDGVCKHILFDTVIEASCSGNGCTIHSCILCGYSFADSVTDKLDHRYGEWEIIYDATLTTNGKKAKTCAACGKEEVEFYQHEWNVTATPDMLEFVEDPEYCSVSLKPEYIDYTGEIRIPAISPEGNIVQIVGSFSGSKASAIHLPDMIVEIKDKAFSECLNLTSLCIPKTVKILGENILQKSQNAKTVYFNAVACERIPSFQMVWGYYSAIEHLVIGDDVEYIPAKLFYEYPHLQKVSGGKKLKSIQDYAFDATPNLKSFVFCEGLESVGAFAFARSGLTSVELPSTVKSIGNSAFSNLPLNCDRLVIPAGLQSIGENAFSGKGTVKELVWEAEEAVTDATRAFDAPFSGLVVEKLTVSPNVRVLGNCLFARVGGFTEVVIDIQGDTLPDDLFYEVSQLEKVVLGENVKKIGESVFVKCTSLKEIVGAEHITHLGDCAFSNCTGITFFDFTNVVEWGRYVFEGSGLCEVVLPEDMTVLPTAAFALCSQLKEVTLPVGLTTISEEAFCGCILETLVLPDTVTEIGVRAFYYCTRLTDIQLSSSLNIIGTGAFEGCSALKTLEIPEGVTSIGSFLGCSALERIVIPSTVTDFTDSACFKYCAALKDVIILAPLTELPYRMFAGCSSLESVTLPETLLSVSGCCFYECVSLKEIVVPDSCTSLEWCAFYGCTQLQTVTLGENITHIDASVFSNCTSLTEIMLPNSVLDIGDWAFAGCTSLDKIYLGSSVQRIGDRAFQNCTALKTVFLPSSLSNVSSVGYYGGVFEGCEDITLYTDAEQIPTAWETCFGAGILTGYIYEEYLQAIGENVNEQIMRISSLKA